MTLSYLQKDKGLRETSLYLVLGHTGQRRKGSELKIPQIEAMLEGFPSQQKK